ncbi:transcriptional regulator [Haloechinothrix sp. LS1_15]|uniref:helix-turn-helix transcriptional regulator n=1 Tax=Haloechinothrix sp. LS1_15 TaxID=2652248 RepID=UPI00294B4972|nr:transcriptional regulator [Haloechinothrix sp. LS1_15]
MTASSDERYAAVAALTDGSRRALFDYICRADHPVDRDEAASAVGISRKLAAFHLDKLVEVGLLRAARQSRPPRRTVGRPPKVYEPGDAEIQLSIPHREHTLLAGILLDAIDTATAGASPRDHALRVAHEHGNAIGQAERRSDHGNSDDSSVAGEAALRTVESLLGRFGFEPQRRERDTIWLRNCPFTPLADRSAELVCGINHALLSGLLDGLGMDTIRAVLAPEPGHCCVRFDAVTHSPG